MNRNCCLYAMTVTTIFGSALFSGAFAQSPSCSEGQESDEVIVRPVSKLSLPANPKIAEPASCAIPQPGSSSSKIASPSSCAILQSGISSSKIAEPAKCALPQAGSSASKITTASAVSVCLKPEIPPALCKLKAKHDFSGLADYYHHSFYGKRTASGQVLMKHKLTAAHRTLPFGTQVRVTNKRSGKSVVVVINDRGPFTPNKVIDLSHAAAAELDVLRAGTCLVGCTVLEKTN